MSTQNDWPLILAEDVRRLDLKPGDQVVLSVRRDITPNVAEQIGEAWRRRFPDVPYIVLCGIDVTVVRAEEAHA